MAQGLPEIILRGRTFSMMRGCFACNATIDADLARVDGTLRTPRVLLKSRRYSSALRHYIPFASKVIPTNYRTVINLPTPSTLQPCSRTYDFVGAHRKNKSTGLAIRSDEFSRIHRSRPFIAAIKAPIHYPI